MKKKFLALVMTLSMVLSLVPMTALATGDSTTSVTQEGQSAGADANGSNQEGGSNADSDGSTDTSKDSGANTENKDENTGSGSESTGDPSKPEDGGTPSGGGAGGGTVTEPTEQEKPEVPKYAAQIGDDKYPTVTDAIDAIKAESSDNTITLLRDVTENIKIKKSLTLDLGGFTLSGDGTKTVVSISGKEKDMAVTVKNGTVTGGHATNGGGFDIQRGNIEIENCIIEENTATSGGGGVNIGGSANVKIKDSEICKNTAANSGGAIYMASSWGYDGYYDCACEIVDTKLNNNSANIGGALGMGASMYQYQDMHITASFTMSGKSEISSNTAKTTSTTRGGGGVYLVGNGSRFIMNDGFITDNVAENSCGGAIFSENWRGITLNGGSITGNSAKMHGGAIYIKNVNLKDNPLEDEVLNVAAGVTITDNHCGGNGGGIAAMKDVTVKIAKNSALYNNTAKTIGDDVYSGSGNQLNLPEATEMSGDLILSSDNVPITDWYYDGFKDASTRHRWGEEYNDGLDIDATKANGVPTFKTGIYYEIFKPVQNFEGTIALKAAHAQLFTLTYNVTGDLPEGYTAPDAQRMLIDSEYTVAEVPASMTGTKDGVNGTFTFAGWKDKDGKVLSGEQKLTGDVTLYGEWTFTKKSSSGGHRPSNPPVTIPDDVPTGLNGKDHYAYVVGYPDGMVYPQKNITRAEVATIFFRLLEDETREANMTKSNGYNDMKEGAWYTCAVSTLSKMGIIKGYEDGSFKPDASISRAEFAAIAARFDPDGDKTPATFSDVSSHWAKDEISIAANHGWIKGYEDGSFKPDQKITRAETMTLVNRVLKRLPETKDDLHKDMKTWPDNQNESAWFYLAVQEATNSHYQNLKKDGTHEKWESMRETRDWAALEK